MIRLTMIQTVAKAFFISLLICSSSVFAQIAKDKCKYLGSIISNSTPSDFDTYWNQVTPENAGKWGSVEGSRNTMVWTALDNAYHHAKGKGYTFRQHTFVWGQQQPSWLAGLSAEEQKAEVEQWIKAYCERYPDTDYIDVVNEPLHETPVYAPALGGNGTTGIDWVVWSFEKARQYCPNAKLHINDYNILSSNSATDQYVSIINTLKSKNLIDGIGEQGHFLETTPLTTIKTNLDKLAATGLPIYITEYDVNIEGDTEQSQKYQEQFPVFWNHASVHGITLWGYIEGAIWRTNAYLVRSTGTERPALTYIKQYVSAHHGGTFCDEVTSAEDDLKNRISITPNPVDDGMPSIHIDYGVADVKLMDVTGRVHAQGPVREHRPFRPGRPLPSGLYIVCVNSGSASVTQKILIR